MNIFELTGPEFLSFYWIAFVVAMVLAFALPHALRFPFVVPFQPPVLSPYEVAYLKGGSMAAFKVALVSLWQRTLVSIGNVRTVTRNHGVAANAADLHPIEQHILTTMGAMARTDKILGSALPERVLSKRRLVEQGLLLGPLHRELLRVLRTLPPFLLLIAGIIKVGIGVSRGRPVEFLLIWCAITVGATIFWFMRVPRVSWRASRLLDELAKRKAVLRFTSRRHRSDTLPAEAAMSVALFGLVASAWGYDLVDALSPPPKASMMSFGTNSSNCSSGGCGGGGCGGGGGGGGGGGCGGCGGGGH